VVMFVLFLTTDGVIILRFGGVEEEERMLVLSFEDRLGVDLGPLRDLAKVFLR